VATATDGAVRARLRAEIQAARAAFYLVDPRAAAGAASAALTYFTAAKHPLRVVLLIVARARAEEAAGDLDGAARDLADAIEQFEAQRAQLHSEDDRAISFEQGRAAYTELIRLEAVLRQSPERAFAVAERGRLIGTAASLDATTLAAASAGPAALARNVPKDTAVISFAALDDRVLAWTLADSGVSYAERRTGRDELSRAVERYRRALNRRADRSELAAAAEPVFGAVLAESLPHLQGRTRLVIVPDGPLFDVPFAALLQPSGRFVIEDYRVEIAPSVTNSVRPSAELRLRSALTIGDGHVPDSLLPALPNADREATAVAGLYPIGLALTGRQATRGRMLELAPRHDVLHFAGHSVANVERPRYSYLVLGADRDSSGVVFAGELYRTSFAATQVVVLASCDTARGRAVTGEGSINLVRPFLSGGARFVIASLWQADDRQTPRLFTEFHRQLRVSRDPAGAMQRAQLAALHSDDPEQATPRTWGPFLVYTGHTRHNAVKERSW
jgi:CHAT domain-containing protein